jgi:hypothetical protein
MTHQLTGKYYVCYETRDVNVVINHSGLTLEQALQLYHATKPHHDAPVAIYAELNIGSRPTQYRKYR